MQQDANAGAYYKAMCDPSTALIDMPLAFRCSHLEDQTGPMAAATRPRSAPTIIFGFRGTERALSSQENVTCLAGRSASSLVWRSMKRGIDV